MSPQCFAFGAKDLQIMISSMYTIMSLFKMVHVKYMQTSEKISEQSEQSFKCKGFVFEVLCYIA